MTTVPRACLIWSAVLVALLPGAFAPPASAWGRASVYTSLANRACRFDRIGSEAGAEEAQTKRCRGRAGLEVIVDVGGTTTGLGFSWPQRRPRVPEARQIVVGWSLGQKLEWRGTGASSDAVNVRVIFNEPEDDTKHQVLAVLHVTERDACLVGAVDMSADSAPYEVARRLADLRSPTFVCGRDAPTVPSRATTWTTRLLKQALRNGN